MIETQNGRTENKDEVTMIPRLSNAVSPVSRHSSPVMSHSKDFVVFHVSRHFPYPRNFPTVGSSYCHPQINKSSLQSCADYEEEYFCDLNFLADIFNFDNLCSRNVRHDDGAFHFLSMWNNKDIKFRSTLLFVYTHSHTPSHLFKLKT